MKHGDSSPEEDPLNRLAETKAAEYLNREHRERVLAIEANLQALYQKLGLAPGQTLRDYFGFPPNGNANEEHESHLDPALRESIENLFEDIFRSLTEDGTAEDFPKILGAPRPQKKDDA